MPSASPELSARELLRLAIGSILLAVLMFWPLAMHLDTDLPKDLGDPLSQAWQLAWGAHAIVHQPLSFFQANQFWPLPDTLAFSDALVGYAPLDFPGSGVTAAIVRYNVVFLGASALAFAGAYLLARELRVRPLTAAVAGAAFAYAPWRLEQGGHLHILSSGGIALSLFLLLRGYRRGSAATVVAGWLVVAWQVSIGFSLGLPYLVVLATGALVVGLVRLRRPAERRPPFPRPLLWATAAGVAVLLVVCVVIGRPYLRVQGDHPEARRSAQTVAVYSVGPSVFLASSALNPIWGSPTAGLRAGYPAVAEQTLFPGLVVLLLAIAGALWTPWPRAVRGTLVACVGIFGVLSLGFEVTGLWQYAPYRLLYDLVPGWSGIRVPERLNVFTSLALALLAAGGAARALAALRGREAVASAAGAALVLLILAEGTGMTPGRWYPHPTAPTAPAGLAGLGGRDSPLLQLPAAAQDNREYLLWSADGLPAMVNGRSSITPRETAVILHAAEPFPDADSVAYLRLLGVQTVVLHRTATDGTPWEDWRERSVVGLPVTRTVRGALVVYRLARRP